MLRLLCAFALLSVSAAIEVCAGEGPRYGDFKCNHDRTHRVCAKLKDDKGEKIMWGNNKNFWQTTVQPDWSEMVGADAKNPGGNWCICMWATASLINAVGCDKVHLDCESTDLAYVEKSYTDGGVDLAVAKECLLRKCGVAKPAKATAITTPQSLWDQYSIIFATGNRNAASHLWFSHVASHASTLTNSVFLTLSKSYCSVSGSPVSPDRPLSLFETALPLVTSGGARVKGFMYHCCWPCGCDAKDFLHLDTKSITTKEGPKTYYVTVVGDPCQNPSKITTSFLASAPEIQCVDGKLKGATFSDHGYPILSLYYTTTESNGVASSTSTVTSLDEAMVTRNDNNAMVGHFNKTCGLRAQNGYKSGMGRIFRELATMTPIVPKAAAEEEVSQTVNLADVDATAYNTDTKLKQAVEMGYGMSLGICTCSSKTCAYKPGCSVSSQASRRGGATVTLTAVVKGIPVPSDGLVSVTRLASNMQTVVQTDASLSGVTVPAATGMYMSSAPASAAATPVSARDEDDSSNTAIIVGVTVPAVFLIVVGVGYFTFVRQPDSLSVTPMAAVAPGQPTSMEDKMERGPAEDEQSTMSDASDVELARHPYVAH